MRIIGLTKVRSESKIMKETLDHWGNICTGGIYVYDDVSTDDTVQICKDHPAVNQVIEGTFWDPDREKAEWFNRQAALTAAKENAMEDDWFVYFDADERLYNFNYQPLYEEGVDAIACRLYDIYITPEDVDKSYLDRDRVGPEYRTIVFFFRNHPALSYDKPDQRIVNLKPKARVVLDGIIKHYGKGLSVEHWKETCDYYINHWPKYQEKWKKRRDNAIKTDHKSDFGNTLISFNDVLKGEAGGFSLESQSYGKN